MHSGASTGVNSHVNVVVLIKNVSMDGEFITFPSRVDSLVLKL